MYDEEQILRHEQLVADKLYLKYEPNTHAGA